MFARLLLVINIAVSILGVYLFDYKADSVINSPLMIILSILMGTVVMLIVFFLYIDVFYFLVAKRKPQNSRIKHIIAKQIMTVPIFATNMRIKVIGLENLPENPGFAIYSNHTSMMDVPVLMYKLYKYPIAFLTRKAIGNLFAAANMTIFAPIVDFHYLHYNINSAKKTGLWESPWKRGYVGVFLWWNHKNTPTSSPNPGNSQRTISIQMKGTSELC